MKVNFESFQDDYEYHYFGGSGMSVSFAILTKGRCFFRPSAKGLHSRRSLNLLQGNKLILRGATFGGSSSSESPKKCD
jgi:hypothetical protein